MYFPFLLGRRSGSFDLDDLPNPNVKRQQPKGLKLVVRVLRALINRHLPELISPDESASFGTRSENTNARVKIR